MDISIIIVNYNARAFLDICLQSVKKAIANINAEVFVVDNDSSDGAPEMVAKKHPWVNLISNNENVGFSTANNQAIKLAKGKFVLIQNPDTIVAEDSYEKCIDFMELEEDAGALGVYMMDGSGGFLPESKRGIPSPLTACYKAFGLANTFPQSAHFNRYYLGHLSNKFSCDAEILAGAFMLVRKSALDKAGLFDETFFMFGEDIDLSYRIIGAGFKNLYFADAPIVHFKGESSKKTDKQYLNSFFGAMDIFYEKHFANKGSLILRWMVKLGIFAKSIQFRVKTMVATNAPRKLPESAVILGNIKEQQAALSLTSNKMNIDCLESLSDFISLADADGQAVIFGSNASFSEALEFMQKHPNKFIYLFLSSDNDFLLGSPSSDSPGFVWEN